MADVRGYALPLRRWNDLKLIGLEQFRMQTARPTPCRRPVVTATTTQAKLAGLWIERSEQTRKQPDEMSDAEIAAIPRGNPLEDMKAQRDKWEMVATRLLNRRRNP
jgi:hypothetical protein